MTEQEKRKVVNHFLTLYIGECWHIGNDSATKNDEILCCDLCHKPIEFCEHFRPDFYTPNDFFHLRKWMEKNEAELWSRYLRTIYRDTILHSALLNSLPILFREWLNPANLYEFLVRERARWENIQDESRVVGYQHPAAVYLDSLEGK